MRRRDFIRQLGGAAAWPLAARAQQATMPVVGFLNSQSPDGFTERLRAFQRGLKDTGYVEGENVAIEYRWADNQLDRLAGLAGDLVRRQVAVIVANGPAAAFAKAATTTIPIVFLVAEDPVRLGLVASLARPAGNATGINFLVGELVAKQLGLLRELVPRAIRIAVLINPSAAVLSTTADAESAAHAMGLQARIFNASNSREVNDAFATIAQDQHEALLVGPGPYFLQRRTQLVLLRHKLRRERPFILRRERRFDLAPQHGQRDRISTSLATSRRRMVAMEFGTCRSGRSGGSSGSVTFGKGKLREENCGNRS